MKNKPLVDLGPEVPERTAAILSRLTHVEVRRHRPSSFLQFGGASWPLVFMSGGLRPYAQATAGLLESVVGEDRLGMVVADRLPAHVRRELEDVGCAYADATGAVHIDVPGLLLHIERGKPHGGAPPTGPSGVGVVGVRTVQAILGEPQREWSVADLAEAAASSTGQVHKVLTRLESEGLVAVSGRGPARRRRIVNPADLLDWVAAIPSARRIRERLEGFLYAPDPSGLATRLSFHAAEAGLDYALTGSAGAAVLGARVATAVPLAMVRVSPDVELPVAAKMLGAERVEGGANLLLVRDVGQLGIHGSVRNGPVAVAPPVRVWLDMLGEPRGEDAAALFREAIFAW